MAFTDIYRLFYLEAGQDTSACVNEEFKRWAALETQLFELYSLFGNGVLTGWEIRKSSNTTIYITPGTGHIGFKSAVTINNTAIVVETPPDITFPDNGLTFYVYAKETINTHIDRSVDFFVSPNKLSYSDYNFQYTSQGESELSPGGLIIIGEILVKQVEDDLGNIYTTIDDDPTYEFRDEITLFDNLSYFIKNHIHVGGANNPSKINLYRHVTGKLSGDYIDWIDASLIKKGKINQDRLPTFDHNDLEGIGILSHSDIDTLLLAINLNQDNYLGDVSIANQIQLVLMLKHIYSTIDNTLLNLIVFVPGLPPNTDEYNSDWIDLDATTATIDYDNNRILGYLASSAASDFVKWDTKTEFQTAIDEYNVSLSDYKDSDLNPNDLITRSENISLDDDGVISIEKTIDFSSVFSKTDSADWFSSVQIISNNSSRSDGNFTVNYDIGYFTFRFFYLPGTTTIDSQDWRISSKLEFSFELSEESQSDHGDIYMFLIGSVPSDFDSTNSNLVAFETSGGTDKIVVQDGVKILDQGSVTDEPRFTSVDLQQFSDLSSISGIGFYTRTSSGWDPEVPFQFVVTRPDAGDMSTSIYDYISSADPTENILIYRYNDSLFQESGYLKLRFTTNQLTNWTRIIYDSLIPAYSGYGVDPNITIFTRTADTEDGLSSARAIYIEPHETDPGTYVLNQSNSYWIEVQINLIASGNRLVTPTFSSLTLHYTLASGSNLKAWNTYSTWQNYDEILNINLIDGTSDYIELEKYSNVNSRHFIEGNVVKTIDKNDEKIVDYTFDGFDFPISPIQAFFKLGSGLIHPTQVEKLDNGNYLISDTGNDRVIEMTSAGQIYKIFQGNSYLPLKLRDLVVLTASYNSRLGQVAITFSQMVELAKFDFDKVKLMTENGTNQILLNETNSEISIIGSALHNNLVDLDDDEFTDPSNSSQIEAGTQKQKNRATIIPGIGKSGSNSSLQTIIGSIVLFDLTSESKARVEAWGSGDLIIQLDNGAYVPTGGEVKSLSSASAQSIESAPSAQWFEEETDTSSSNFGSTSGEHGATEFVNNYNPFIFSTETDSLIEAYPNGSYSSTQLISSSTVNFYGLLPYLSYASGTSTVYLTEPRYNVPWILMRMSGLYTPTQIDDFNQLYSDLELSDDEWVRLGDFDDDGNADSTVLIDTQSNDFNLEVSVQRADIIYWDILHPVSVIKESESRYVIAQANKHSIVSLTTDGIKAWSVLDTSTTFSIGEFGSARLLSDGNLIASLPSLNLIVEIDPEQEQIIKSISTKYSPIDAYKLSNGNILVLISQKTPEGLNSRAYIFDSTTNVVWDYGLGRLKLPTGVSILSNDHVLISC